MESRGWMFHCHRWMHKLLCDENGRPARRYGGRKVWQPHAQERRTICMDRYRSIRSIRAGCTHKMETAPENFRELDVGPFPRKDSGRFHRPCLGGHGKNAAAHLSDTY